MESWTLDGLIASAENSNKGMHFNEGYFKTGETYHITVIKTRTQLFFKVEGKEYSRLFSWDLSEVNPITEGRIGLRHMYTCSSIYRNFKIYKFSN
jgi:hypothetical protein